MGVLLSGLFKVLRLVEIEAPVIALECWKKIRGFDYEVSDLGRVYSRKTGKMLKCFSRARKGYGSTVILHKDGKPTCHFVHKLVLEAFVGRRPKDMQACHNDGDKENNRLNNLRWDTPKNNCRDKRHHGTHGGRPVVRSDGKEYLNSVVAAEEMGCHRNSIANVCRPAHKAKTLYGYGWRYK